MTDISRIGGSNILPNLTKINHTNVSEVKKRSGGDIVEITHHMIDRSKTPFRGVDDVYYLKEHNSNEKWFEWNFEKIHLFGGNFQNIHHALREAQKEIVLLNANVLDYLLIHSELNSSKWKHFSVFFCGTIYGNYKHLSFVRCLRYDVVDNAWHSHFVPLGDKWDDKLMFIISVAE